MDLYDYKTGYVAYPDVSRIAEGAKAPTSITAPP